MPALQRPIAPQANDQSQIQHFTHPHPLPKLFISREFRCNGCNMSGYGMRYRCSGCDFDLHEQCATSPNILSSHIHPQHHLMLVNRPGNICTCDVCGNWADGLSYTCRACNFDVHPLCTQTACTLNNDQPDMDNQPHHQSRCKRWFKNCLNVGKFAAKLFLTCLSTGGIPVPSSTY